MVSQKDLKNLIGNKVLDFAVLNGPDNFSVVFENGKALKFDCDPIEIIEVEEIEEERKERVGLGKRFYNFIDGLFTFSKAVLKILFIIFVILILLVILFILMRYWPEISSFVSSNWENITQSAGIV